MNWYCAICRIGGPKTTTRFRCVVCGKLTAGRIPNRGHADLSFRFPRRHKLRDGHEVFDCPGNIIEAEWVDQRVN